MVLWWSWRQGAGAAALPGKQLRVRRLVGYRTVDKRGRVWLGLPIPVQGEDLVQTDAVLQAAVGARRTIGALTRRAVQDVLVAPFAQAPHAAGAGLLAARGFSGSAVFAVRTPRTLTRLHVGIRRTRSARFHSLAVLKPEREKESVCDGGK